MVLSFNELRATEAAARFLKLWGGPMNYLKLAKMLYMLDREALLRWARPVTTDRYVSVDNGPVVGRIYDLLREESTPGAGVIWRRHISGLENGEVALLVEPEANELSHAEEGLIEEIFGRFGAIDTSELVRLSRELPEWRRPNGGEIPIDYSDVLRAGNKTETEIATVEAELSSLASTEAILRREPCGGQGSSHAPSHDD